MLIDVSDQIKAKSKLLAKKVVKSTSSYYDHDTYRITNLSDYIKLIELLEDFKPKNWYENENYYFYRGFGNKEYGLVPSIEISELLQFERHIVTDFYNLRPEEFTSLSTSFELLAKMQHYGLPTRLLDFTLNPLVALFFACGMHEETESQKDGRVVVMLSDFDVNSVLTIDAICSMYKCVDDVEEGLKAKCLKIFEKCPLNKYLQSVYNDHPEGLMARAPYVADRERRQNAVFMIFPNNLSLHGKVIDDKEGHHIFQDLYSYEQDNVCMLPSIKRIESKQMAQHYISVIVPYLQKFMILSQLDSIGINEAFLFPELEYTAKWLRDKYKETASNSK
jgi:hypothetical protein